MSVSGKDRMTYIYYGTSPIPVDLLSTGVKIFKCGFVQSYGMTATTSAIVGVPPEDHAVPETRRMRSAGDFVETLPGNLTGKVMKGDLRKPYWAGLTRTI